MTVSQVLKPRRQKLAISFTVKNLASKYLINLPNDNDYE